MYGTNRHELVALRSYREQLNLSEISECDDSSDTETITLSRVQEITTQEIARFKSLTQSETKSPPHKKLRVQSPSVSGSSVTLKLVIPASICDDTSAEVSPQSTTNESIESRSIELEEFQMVPHKSKTELNTVNLLPRLFRSHSSRYSKQSPKILDLKLLSSINTTSETDLPCVVFHSKDWGRATVNSDSTKSASAAETERLFPDNYNLLCTGLDVPLICKPKANFPAISKITTNIGNLGDSSSYCSSHDFECIYDTAGYGDVKLESPKDEPLEDAYVSYKDICGSATEKVAQNAIISRPTVSDALVFRESQSVQLPFYDVASTSSSENLDSITLVSASEDAQEKHNNKWWRRLCFNFSFCKRK